MNDVSGHESAAGIQRLSASLAAIFSAAGLNRGGLIVLLTNGALNVIWRPFYKPAK